MAVIDKLDNDWGTNETMALLFEVRAIAENGYEVIQETVAKINELVADQKWQDIDNELRQTVTQVINEFEKAKTELDKESDFLTWRQPE